MLFDSFEFACFFAVVLALYAVLSHRAQNRLLLLASYLFYAAWDWRFLGLIVASTLVDFGVGLALAASDDPRRRRLLLGASVVVNLGLLGTFKYLGFFADGLAALLAPAGIALPRLVSDVVLPVGISFYTFQTLGYTIDVHRRQIEPTRRLLDFALFVAFFPQLVAGPIERAGALLPQVLTPRRMTWEKAGSGAWLVFWGVFKKVVIADNLAPPVDAVFSRGADPTGAEVLVACYAFTLQLYADFSGYTDVARGVARILGFELMLNFRLPYLATDIADFWRRWHVSLSSWMRDYVYIPLGGNRRRVDRNLLLTLTVCGLWHGAGWTYVVFGAYHGVLLVLHRHLRPWIDRFEPAGASGRRISALLRGLVTFHLVVLGWLVFRAESLGQAASLLAALGSGLDPGQSGAWIAPLALLAAPLVCVSALQHASGDLERVLRLPLALRAGIYVVLGLALLLLGEDLGEAYIYFQF